MLLKILTDTRWSALIFICLLLGLYAVLPLILYYHSANHYFLQLAQLCIVACVNIAIGFLLPLFDYRYLAGAPRVGIGSGVFHVIVWGTFALFLGVTFSTASSIPIISVFQGAGADELSQQRGDFLKGRVGVEAALLYLSTLFVCALLPYSLAKLYILKSRFRYWLTLIFFFFSISFLQKALFINVLLPLFYLVARRTKINVVRIFLFFLLAAVVLYIVTILASGGKSDFDVAQPAYSIEDFFSAGYSPTDAANFLLWRSIAVPVFTASDTLLVFDDQFGGESLLGATSSFLAGIFSLERIPMEKIVFAYQWGWNDIANANSVFFTDAYINFGWIGVVLYSLFIGQSLRWFHMSRDEAFKSLWTIYCFSLFSGPLVGTLLSNGYILMFSLALFVKIKDGLSLYSINRAERRLNRGRLYSSK